MTVTFQGLDVTWYGYATVRLETPAGFVAYLDPGRYGVLTGDWTPPGGGNPREAAHPRATDHRPRDADLVCVTHDHHYDSDGIERVAGDDCTVVIYENVEPGHIDRDVAPVEELPGEVVRIGEEDHLVVDTDGTGDDAVEAESVVGDGGDGSGGTGRVDVWTVPAYDDPDGPRAGPDGSVSHPPGFGVGYRLALDGTTVFWPGDGDPLDAYAELEVDLYLANIAWAVVDDEPLVAALAARMRPDLVLPVHYNTIESLTADSGRFVRDVASRGVPVVLDERGPHAPP